MNLERCRRSCGEEPRHCADNESVFKFAIESLVGIQRIWWHLKRCHRWLQTILIAAVVVVVVVVDDIIIAMSSFMVDRIPLRQVGDIHLV
jgi:hypothetical protein